MIVTCPSCTARYKVPESKITERGAKITCPNCSHKFVVKPGGEVDTLAEGGGGATAPAAPKLPSDLARRDFKTVGILWKVRKSIGLTYDFHDLATLREYMSDAQVTRADGLSWDHKMFTAIQDIPDLDAYFWDTWQRAERGEIASPSAPKGSDEDDSDAPTQLVGQGSSLAEEIRRAVNDLATPAPAASRDTEPLHDVEAPVAPPQPQQPPPVPAEPARPVADPAFQKLTDSKKSSNAAGAVAAGGSIMVIGGAMVVGLLVLTPIVLYLLGFFG